MDEKFEFAVSKKTGKKRTIPAHWLDHPVLGKGWKLAPSAKPRRDDATPTPENDATPEPGGDDATHTSAMPGDTDTPAAGGEQEN